MVRFARLVSLAGAIASASAVAVDRDAMSPVPSTGFEWESPAVDAAYLSKKTLLCPLISCPSGSYCNWITHQCVTCGPGYYYGGTSLFGRTLNTCSLRKRTFDTGDCCRACPAGTYKPSSGVKRTFDHDHDDGDGSASCLACPTGKTSNTGASSCDDIKCPSNQYLSGNNCVNCPAGQFSAGGSVTSCTKCPAGQISSSGGGCHACPTGQTSESGSSTCHPITCPANQYLSGNACVNCPANKFSVAGGSCKDCPAGQQSQSGSGCTNCPQGQTSTSGSSCTPITCPANQYLSGNHCINCPANQYSSGGSVTSCQDCPAGKTSLSGKSCTDCPAGQTSTAGGSCRDCPAGQSSQPGGTCQNCPSGSTSLSGGSCTQCPHGQTSGAGDTTCRCAGADTYRDKDGKCQCKPGYFFGSNGIDCFQCAYGSFSPGGPACQQCPAGTYSPPGAGSCTTCPDGQYAPSPNTPNKCRDCPAGQTNNAHHTGCIPKPSGMPKTKRSQMICEWGLTACPIEGARQNVFECIDTMSNLQSCGGCWSTGAGKDCSDFDPLASAACVQGVCQYTCPTGTTLTATGCVRNAQLFPRTRANVTAELRTPVDFRFGKQQ